MFNAAVILSSLVSAKYGLQVFSEKKKKKLIRKNVAKCKYNTSLNLNVSYMFAIFEFGCHYYYYLHYVATQSLNVGN